FACGHGLFPLKPRAFLAELAEVNAAQWRNVVRNAEANLRAYRVTAAGAVEEGAEALAVVSQDHAAGLLTRCQHVVGFTRETRLGWPEPAVDLVLGCVVHVPGFAFSAAALKVEHGVGA